MATRVTGTGPAEMRLLAARLKTADPALKRELRRNMKALAAPIVAEVRASILSMPSHHGGTLRGEIAATVSASVGITKSGVRLDIISSGRKMPAGMDRLPGFTDSARGFKHPVFGNRKVWVREHGKPGWFEGAIAPAGRAMRGAAEDAIRATARRLS